MHDHARIAGIEVDVALVFDAGIENGQAPQHEHVMVIHIHRTATVEKRIVASDALRAVVEQAAGVGKAGGESLMILVPHGIHQIGDYHDSP